MRRRKKKIYDLDFDMAPMIDLVFLLLVFFMTVSTLAQDTRPELPLPNSGVAKIDTTQSPGLVISLNSTDNDPISSICFQGKAIQLEDLPTIVTALTRNSAEENWVIRAAKTDNWKSVEVILRTLQNAGINNVRFSVFVE